MAILSRLFLALLGLACWLPAAPVHAQATPAGGAETFRSLGYGDLTGHGLIGSLDYFFPVPAGQAPQPGSRLDLAFSHSPLLVPDRSTLTLAVNGQSVASLALTAANSDHGHLAVDLPVPGFSGNGYFVQALFALRLTHDECEPTENPALWLTVAGDSTFTLKAGAADGPGLETLPDVFQPAGGDPAATSSPLTLVLPPDPQPDDLQAAGLAAYQAARWIAAAGKDPAVALAHSAPADRPAIAVGAAAGLPLAAPWGVLSWAAGAFSARGAAVATGDGVLALDHATPPHLLVSGSTPAAALLAATALVRPEERALLKGPADTVGAATLPPLSNAPWQNGAASFAQLGIDRRQVAGLGEHTIDLSFSRPPGWLLQDGSALELSVLGSPALRQETSWVAVSVNGHDLGTHHLGGEADTPTRLRFPLPVDLLNADVDEQPVRQLAVQVRLFLDLPQQGCVQITPDSIWAAVLPTSDLLLPHQQFGGLDLGRFPAPLAGPGQGPATVVLPARPTEAELASGLQVMAALGRWTDGDAATAALPTLVTADKLSAADRQHALILIGGPERNAASAAAARSAPGLFAPLAPAVQQAGAGGVAGGLRLGASPWARGQAVLVLLGDSAEGLALDARALSDSATLGQLHGQGVAVAPDLPPQTLVPASPAEPAPASLTPRVAQTIVQRVPTYQVVGAILLGAFVAIAAAFVLLRWRR